MFKVTNSSSLKWMQWSKCAPLYFSCSADFIAIATAMFDRLD